MKHHHRSFCLFSSLLPFLFTNIGDADYPKTDRVYLPASNTRRGWIQQLIVVLTIAHKNQQGRSAQIRHIIRQFMIEIAAIGQIGIAHDAVGSCHIDGFPQIIMVIIINR